MRIGVEGRGFVVWFGKYTEIANLDSLFGCPQPAYTMAYGYRSDETSISKKGVKRGKLTRIPSMKFPLKVASALQDTYAISVRQIEAKVRLKMKTDARMCKMDQALMLKR